MADYSFVTKWCFEAPIDLVWEALAAGERYSDWWPCFIDYRNLTPEQNEVGSRVERIVKGRLPYKLRYETTVTRFEPLRELAYDAEGGLSGKGRFVLEQVGDKTHVTFYWNVSTKGFWLNLLAPMLKWLFAWNHNWVMDQGEQGLANWLSKRMQESASDELPVPAKS